MWSGMMGRKEFPHGPTQRARIPDELLDQLLAGRMPRRPSTRAACWMS